MTTARHGLVDRMKRVAFRAGTRGALALVETAVVTVRTVDALQSKLESVRGLGRRVAKARDSVTGARGETLFTAVREQVASAAASVGAAVTGEHAPSPDRAPSDQPRTRPPRARAGATGAAARATSPRETRPPGSRSGRGTSVREAGAAGARNVRGAGPQEAGAAGARSGRGTSAEGTRTSGLHSGRAVSATASRALSGTTPSAAELRRAAVTPRGAIESARPLKTAATRRKAPAREASSEGVETASRETGRKSLPTQAAAKRSAARKRPPLKVKRGQKHRH
ncbi:hypothetical protein [Pyxidicoccus xibeiensis]|uniref:hypothetical protein n=1 Tax=Pyxidicoccus xibeiensis TaxID=2906759 RepID=UPI0020A7DE0F|nr:hypothetical protein [Pyxidicoccus xibeiensis]MCP3137244.1 hypothetical protein [Pyxidicoccus xibeiensis]